MLARIEDWLWVFAMACLPGWIVVRALIILIKGFRGLLFKPDISAPGLIAGSLGFLCICSVAAIVSVFIYYDYIRYEGRVVIAGIVAIMPYIIGELLLLPFENFPQRARRLAPSIAQSAPARIRLWHVILIPWLIYVVGAVAALIEHPPSLRNSVFAVVAIAGVFGGISTALCKQNWRLWTGIAALGFLALSLLTHAQFIAHFMNRYPSLIAALNQYLIESELFIRGGIDRNEFVSVFMYFYHEWILPLLQLGILIFMVRVKEKK